MTIPKAFLFLALACFATSVLIPLPEGGMFAVFFIGVCLIVAAILWRSGDLSAERQAARQRHPSRPRP